MKKFIIQTGIFLVFAAGFYFCVLMVWGRVAPAWLKPNFDYNLGYYGYMFTRLHEIKEVTNVDLLFLGSSHAYRGFDTRIFKKAGYESFNLGSSAQTPVQTLALLKRYLDHLQPKTIVYEVYPFTLTSDGVESALDIISNDQNDVYSFEMALEVNNIKTYNTLVYATFRDVFNMNRSYHEPIFKGKDQYIHGGYVEKEMEFYSPESFPKTPIDIQKYQLGAFEEVVKEIKNRGINLVLVYAPITHSRYGSYSNSPYFDDLMASYAQYYNFNEIMDLKDSVHFYDSHHLNQQGVQLFNRKVIDLLEKDGGLL